MAESKDYLSAFKDPKVIDALHKGGHIKPETYESIKKYASGGEVEAAPAPSPTVQIPQVDVSDQGIQKTMQAVGQNNFEALKNQYLQNNGAIPGANDNLAKALDSKATDYALNATASQQQASNDVANKAQAESQAEASHASDQIQKMQALGLQPDAGLQAKVQAAQANTQNDGSPAPNQYAMEKTSTKPQGDFETSTFNSANKNMNQGYALQAKGVTDQAQVAQEEGQKTGQFLQGVTDQMRQDADNQKKIEAVRQSREQEQVDKLNQMNQDYISKAAIDPNRFWNSKSTGQKIMAGIGIALGGLGNKGGNPAIDVINNAINRDIDAQKADADKAKTGIQNQQNIYKDMLDQFQDSRTAESAARLQQLSIAEQQVRAISAQYQGPKALAQKEMLLGQLKEAQSKEQLNFMTAYRTSAGYSQADETQRKLMLLPKEAQEAARKELEDYQKVQNVKQNVNKDYADMLKYRTDVSPDGLRAFNAAQAGIKTKMKALADGRPSDFLEKVIEPLIPSRITSAASMQRFNNQVNAILEEGHAWPTLTGNNIIPKPLNLKRN